VEILNKSLKITMTAIAWLGIVIISAGFILGIKTAVDLHYASRQPGFNNNPSYFSITIIILGLIIALIGWASAKPRYFWTALIAFVIYWILISSFIFIILP
jgi:hypothetical protein